MNFKMNFKINFKMLKKCLMLKTDKSVKIKLVIIIIISVEDIPEKAKKMNFIHICRYSTMNYHSEI